MSVLRREYICTLVQRPIFLETGLESQHFGNGIELGDYKSVSIQELYLVDARMGSRGVKLLSVLLVGISPGINQQSKGEVVPGVLTLLWLFRWSLAS